MFYYRDYFSPATSPKKTIDEIAAVLEQALDDCLCVESAELVEPERLDDEGAIELQINIDWRFGTPLVSKFAMPWKVSEAERCKQFADEILPWLGRDVDCYTDRSDRANAPGRETKKIYERGEYAVSEIEKSLEISEELSQETVDCLADNYRPNAPDICLCAIGIAGRSLDLASTAMGGTDSFAIDNTVSASLEEARRCRAINSNFHLERAARELDYCVHVYKSNYDEEPRLGGRDALRAVAYVNEIADALYVAGRPARWIPVHSSEVCNLMKTLGLIPEQPKFEKGDRVRFWDARGTSIYGRCVNFPERIGIVEDAVPQPGGNASKGCFWAYDVREGDELHKGLTDWDIDWPGCF